MTIMRTAASIFAALTALAVNADVTLQLTPGSIAAHKPDLAAASGKVTLSGTMEAKDFEVLEVLTEEVTILDMSEVTILGSRTKQPDRLGRHANPPGRIPAHAFFQCKVNEIILPETSEIGEAAFAESMTEKVTLSKSTVRIPDHAFYRSAVKEISNTDQIRWIGKEAFSGCVMESLAFPSLTQTGDFAMAGMPELTEVSLPNDARLGKGALMDCPKLVKVNGGIKILPAYFTANSPMTSIPDNASKIGEYAFANSCAETMSLGEDLARIEDGACMGMSSLRMISATQCGSHMPDVTPEAFKGLNPSDITLLVMSGTVDLWKGHDVWGKFNIVDNLDSVDLLVPDSYGISVSLRQGIVEIESEHPISSIEAFSQSGLNIYRESPCALRHAFPTSDIKGHGAVLIRVTNGMGSKAVKMML